MPQFQTLEQAFEWFLENTYPKLSPEDKYALRNVRYSYYKEGMKVSTKRMNRVLNEYSSFEVIYKVEE